LVFFTDRDLGNIFPEVLRKAGINVEKHCDHFADDAIDELWITETSLKGWFCLSRNRDIRYKKNQTAAVMETNGGLFIIVGPKATHQELAENFVATYPKVLRFIEKYERPFIAKIFRPSKKTHHLRSKPASGRVELWLSGEQWKASIL